MNELNMSVEILGGVKFAPPFIKLAVELTNNPAMIDLFNRDTNSNLTNLAFNDDRELVKDWLDWVAIRYWGLEPQPMTKGDIGEVHDLINGVEFKGATIKPISKSTIKKCIDQSFFMKKDDKITGVVLVLKGHIEALVSTVKGMGLNLLSSLPASEYTINIHHANDKALKTLSKFPIKYLHNKTIKGVEFGVYCIKIEDD